LQFGQDFIEAPALDELHDVIVHRGTPVPRSPLADTEDRHDVGVVQPGRRPRLALEAAQLLGVGEGVRRQDLEGHAPAERLLLGLVDDPHAAVADFTKDAEVAQLLGRG
jgi:hypothetical protein